MIDPTRESSDADAAAAGGVPADPQRDGIVDRPLDGASVLVVGLGDSGLAMARWVALQRATVIVADTREAPPQLTALRATLPQARFIAGELSPALLDGVALIAWSPGLPPDSDAARPLLQAARERGIPVCGELELFARALAQLREQRGYAPKLIAVTGTNGKTTTTRLVGHLARAAGQRVAVAGNIGPAALDALRECLAHDDLPQIWALEVSSFQLALSDSFAADCATILNVSQDHLDWHGSMDAYVAAKQRIYGAHTVRVFNRDDPLTHPRLPMPPASAAPAVGRRAPRRSAQAGADSGADSGAPETANAGAAAARRDASTASAAAAQPPAIGFGSQAPDAAPGYGVVRDGGFAWLVEAFADDDGVGRRRKGGDAELRLNRLMPADALRIRGTHNQLNALAALALCRAIGLPMRAMLHALRTYDGEPHRCRLIATVRDVEYYDDSKGTNVGATVAALAGLGRRCVLVAGGDGKGQDFTPLAAAVRRHALAVLLIGRDAPLLRAALEPSGVALIDCDSLPQAIERAAAIATPGDAVLLSPACASFDMFRNYGHRAEVFAAAVQRLAAEAGQPC
ncbi:MAG TPA: UDP-N-acetylmuramoyl-L-alanine--D-glutamate ligase [Burkholderiaceae bacterium]|nr:UDP-N-acetylmuramoyl-L-alanine--D-glutamate ligase [Burkholderiaceae bacterium]